MFEKNREVSGTVAALALRGAQRRGLQLAPLLAGLNFDETTVERQGARVAWNDFAVLLDRIAERVGLPEGIEALAFEEFAAAPAIQVLASVAATPQRMFQRGVETVARQLYPHLGIRGESSGGEILYEIELPREYRPSLAFWHATIGGLRAYPLPFGLQPARVNANISAWRATFFITAPDSCMPVCGAVRAAQRSIAALVPARRHSDTGAPTVGEALAAVDIMFDPPSIDGIARRLGEQFMTCTSMSALTERLERIMRDSFLVERVALWRCNDQGTIVSDCHGRQAVSGDARLSRTLTVGGITVGRVECPVLGLEDGGGTPLFEAMLPWLAIALKTCSSSASPQDGEVEQKVQRAARLWALTSRQTEILRLVVAGLANKEIATTLNTGTKNIEFHVHSILRKSGADGRGRLAAMVWAGEMGPPRAPA